MTPVGSVPATAAPIDDAWPSRYLAEELWLRGRRQVAFGLVRRGLFLAPEAMLQLAARHETEGRAAYDRLVDRLPPEDRAFLASELMLGPASGMLAERAPIVLAFGARIAEVLGSADPEIRDACARVNFLVSLFDLISDGEAVQHVTLLLEDGRLDAVLSGPAGCAALRSSSLGLPVGPARVFGLLTADLFGDLHARRRGSGRRGRLERTVQRAYRAQLRSRAAAGTADSLAVARGKSVLPFLIMGELVALDAPASRREDVLRLAEALGEVFWRADDLADVGSDWLTGDVNSVLDGHRSGPRDAAGERPGISTVLESRALEEASDALLFGVDEALALMRSTAPRDGDAEAWLTWYVVDWLR